MRILVTRPLPAGTATADRLRQHGHSVTLAPLMATEALAWALPDPVPPAVMLTSAVAARLAGPAADGLRALPAFAVGAATAAAAVAAGFRDVRDGGGTAQALLDILAAAGFKAILHLAGADRTPVVVPPALSVTTRTVYRARLLPLEPPPPVDWVLLFSARTAAHFGAEIDRLALARGRFAVAAISAATAAAAGTGWRASVIAARSDEQALLAAIGVPCQ